MTVKDAAQSAGLLVPNVFHVGLRKTGTTYLQKKLLPLFADRALYVKNMKQLGLADRGELRPIILSDESLTNLPYSMLEVDPRGPERIAEINPNAQIIISIRSQFSILRSMYGLSVKVGYPEGYSAYIDDAIAHGTLDYFSIVEAYRNKFGRENVSVVLFEQMIKEPTTVIKQLAESLRVGMPAGEPDKTPERETPGDLFIETGRIANRILGPKPTGWRAGVKFVFQVSAHKLDRGKPWLFDTKPFYGKLREAFAESNEKLFRTLGPNKYYSAYPGSDAGTAGG